MSAAKIWGTIALLLLFLQASFSQGIVVGTVTDANTNEPLIGVNVYTGSDEGTVTDLDGRFIFKSDKNLLSLRFTYVGYEETQRLVNFRDADTLVVDVSMNEIAQEIEFVVVSASKYEQKFGEQTVSMEILKPSFIENSSSFNSQDALNKVSGVNIIDGSANIRGGSGYVAGAGSRVLVLLDEIPALSPDGGVVEWEALPLETIEQIEVTKGASSTIYGSGALNGIINIVTANPREEPYTKIILYNGIYSNFSKNDTLTHQDPPWWGKSIPYFGGITFTHRNRLSDEFDLVVGGAYARDRSYLVNAYNQRVRLNVKFKYKPKNVPQLSVGINSNVAHYSSGFFFIWDGVDSTGELGDLLVPLDTGEFYRRPLNFDPYLTYFDKKDNKHSFKSRFYFLNHAAGENEGGQSKMFYGEYSFHKNFENIGMNISTGVTGFYTVTEGKTSGSHRGSNAASYLQAEQKLFDIWTLSAGLRLEYFRVDDEQTAGEFRFFGKDRTSPIKPVLRFGTNVQLSEATYLRASIGQGYRFPTIIEKYISVVRSGVRVFPNPDLTPETGWSAEIGIKQGLKVSNWQAFFDFAAFITEYRDMIEFTFGFYPPCDPNDPNCNIPGSEIANYFGFQSQNKTDARISGFEISGVAQGKIFGVPLNFILGYTFMNPIDLNLKKTGKFFELADSTNILQYRFRHSFKADVQTSYKKLTVGMSMIYNSFMERIDNVQESAAPGLKDYRDILRKRSGFDDWVTMDLRVAYQINDKTSVSLITKNLLNREYTARPGKIEPPRNYTLQFVFEL